MNAATDTCWAGADAHGHSKAAAALPSGVRGLRDMGRHRRWRDKVSGLRHSAASCPLTFE